MVTYNPREWFSLIFHFHRSDTFRVLLPLMLLLGLITGGLAWLEIHHHFEIAPSIAFHQIVGFVLSMLLVFRINSAYERWWEGRKLWGALVNNSRSLAAKYNAFLTIHVPERAHLLNMCMLFPALLRDHLRNERPTDLKTDLDRDLLAPILSAHHRPCALYAAKLAMLERLKNESKLTEKQLLRLNSEVFSLIDITGACERIKGSPIPFSYSLFLKKTIFIYTVTMPFPFSAQFGYWAIPAVMILFYAFASIELVSEEVEEPFGLDSNDLPIDILVEKISADVSCFIQSEASV